MTRAWVSVQAIVGATTLIVSVVAATGAQSPSVPPSVPVEPSLSVTGPDAPVTLGPVTWKRVTKGKDFTTNPGAYAIAQLPDGRRVVLGTVGDVTGQPTGAGWVSKDGARWTRLKLKSPKGSALSGFGVQDGTIIVTGSVAAGVPADGGLVWTSPDGTTWSAAQPLDGPIYSLGSVPTGLLGAGTNGDAAAAWLTTDGLTWSATTLAQQGRALHVLVGPDGTIVIAGAIGEIQGDSSPAVWTSTDGGTTWSQTVLEGLPPGYWSIPAATVTPFGFLVTLSELGQGGSIGRVWTSLDGTAWTESLVDPAGSLLAAGVIGTDAMVIGHGQVQRSSDGVTWTATDEPSFQGWAVRDVMTLDDGRLFAAGDAFGQGMDSSLAVWTGEAEAAAP